MRSHRGQRQVFHRWFFNQVWPIALGIQGKSPSTSKSRGHKLATIITVTTHDVGQTTFQIFNIRSLQGMAMISEATVLSTALHAGILI